ncbi:MAG: hypothetical protein KC443_22355, partial [Anaerolineales bacterium]|nr:hypothetical protein [Anaerolineales bacterium]
MTLFTPQFDPFARRMRDADLPEIFIETFAFYYDQLVKGDTGMIPEAAIKPVLSLPDVESFPQQLAEVGEKALRKTAVIKLN